MKKIKKTNLVQWLDKIASEYELIAPVKENVIQFRPVDSGSRVVTEFSNSVIPLKHLFFPQNERLFAWQHGEQEGLTLPEKPERKRVIWGIRPCDVKSLLLLDKVFGGDLKDSYYLERRENTVLIGLGCTQPLSNCFCESLDVDPTSSDGTDIFLIETEKHYLISVSTDKGARLVDLASDLFSDTASEHEPGLPATGSNQLSPRVNVPVQKAHEAIGRKWDSKIWTEIFQMCIECGICTYLCPTCHCFDVEDREEGRGGSRSRTWDSCLFPDFTLMASGENPRPKKSDRMRNRFFHKFKHLVDNHGAFGCVGCGRCITHCPVGIDVRKVLDMIACE
jgi:NAD-dependent dihydropyrimidine dehydrogenase PreA subunit